MEPQLLHLPLAAIEPQLMQLPLPLAAMELLSHNPTLAQPVVEAQVTRSFRHQTITIRQVILLRLSADKFAQLITVTQEYLPPFLHN
jgi:hypothetical protein